MDAIVIRGRRYLSLETVAACYAIEVGWLRTVYEFGLLGEGEPVAGGVAIAVEMLDRVAVIQRLHVHVGVNLEGIALLLPDDE